MKHILFALLLAVGPLSIAQSATFSVTKSEVFKDKKKHTELVFSEGDGKGGLIAVRLYYGGLIKVPKGYYIEHYDSNLNLISSTEIDDRKSDLLGMLLKDGKINLIERKIADKKFTVNVLTSDMGKLDFSSRELFSFDESDILKYFGALVGPVFLTNSTKIDGDSLGQLSFSAYQNFMVFNFDIKDDDNEVHRIFVYDNDFNLVYEKEFKKDIQDKYFDYEDIAVDDLTGAVYFLGKVYEGKSRRSKKKGKVNYHYELFKIDRDGQTSLSFRTEERFVASLAMLKGDNYFSCVGFYSDRNDNRYKGVVRFDLNMDDLSMKKSSFQPFTEEFIMDKYGKKKEKELKFLDYRDIFMLDDSGDIIVNAEEYFVTSSYDMNTGANYTYFNYFDIVSAKISADGELVWARNINKKQTTANPVFNSESFTSTERNGKVYIFLNGSKKIKQIRNNRIEFKDASAKNYNLYVIEIDEQGEFSYKIIQTSDELEVPLFVSQGIFVNNEDDIIFLGRRKTNKQLLKVSFN